MPGACSQLSSLTVLCLRRLAFVACAQLLSLPVLCLLEVSIFACSECLRFHAAAAALQGTGTAFWPVFLTKEGAESAIRAGQRAVSRALIEDRRLQRREALKKSVGEVSAAFDDLANASAAHGPVARAAGLLVTSSMTLACGVSAKAAHWRDRLTWKGAESLPLGLWGGMQVCLLALRSCAHAGVVVCLALFWTCRWVCLPCARSEHASDLMKSVLVFRDHILLL